jgi:hypothetical protein
MIKPPSVGASFIRRIDRNKSFNGPEHLHDYEGFLTWSKPDAEGKNCTCDNEPDWQTYGSAYWFGPERPSQTH